MSVIDLRGLKLPVSQVITIDFETYYGDDYTLSKLTTEQYVRDPRFEVIGVGVRLDDGQSFWMEEAAFRKWVAQVDFTKVGLLAHHAHFDGFILSEHYGVRPGFWFDTLSMARALLGVEVGGSLGKVMAHFGVGAKGHEVVLAKGKRRRDFDAVSWTQYGNYCLNDCRGTAAIFEKMAPSFPVSEFYLVDFTVREFTEPALVADVAKLQLALQDENARKTALLSRSASDRETLMSNGKFALALVDLGVEPPLKWSEKQEKETFAFAKSDPGMQELLDHPRDEVRWLAEARVGVKSTINESRIGRFLAMGRQNKPVPVYLKYSGAHTHRWSGGDKVNFQNLPRGGVLRDSLLAPPGHKVIAIDSGQIEARGVAWLAEDSDLLADFANNVDVYSKFASEVYGRPVDRKKPEDKIAGFVGKVCVLGLGYSMGWRKFALYLLGGAMGGPPVQFTRADAQSMGVDVAEFRMGETGGQNHGDVVASMVSRLSVEDLMTHCAVAKFIVDRYRRVRKNIPELWRRTEKLITAMTQDVSWGGTFGPGDGFTILRHAIKLPNGLVLRYPGLEKRDGGYTYISGHGKLRTKLYGGLLVENLVQSFCRVIVADQAVEIYNRTLLRPVTTTHDELVYVARGDEAEMALDTGLRIMKTPLWWCPNLPLNAEGGFGDSYGDAK